MALTAQEQKLLDFAKGTLPTWFTDSERELEFLAAAAKIMGQANTQIADWFGNTLIGTAVGPTGPDPDWLNQHAIDRGTARQGSETDVALRARLRNIEDALTRPTILSAAQAILDAEGIPSPLVAMVELRIDQGYFGIYSSDTGTGGEFTDEGGGVFKFTPTVPFQSPLFRAPLNAQWGMPQLMISGAASAGNDGTFPITATDGAGVLFANGSGVAEVDATATWEVEKRDGLGNVIADGRGKCFFNRGYRFHGTPRTAIILILPFGCTAGTAASVVEMLRQKAGAGVAKITECRANP